MTVLVHGGRVVTPGAVIAADVLCRDGRIVDIGPGLAASEAAAERVDATDCFVLPGGVDPHCHLMSGLTDATRAALVGGTTTALSFSLPEDGESTVSAFRRAAAKVDAGEAMVDVGLHAMCYSPNTLTEADFVELGALGADAVKIFLAYPELGIMATGDGLFRAMTYAAAHGLPVQVHCEDGELIEALVQRTELAAEPYGAPVFAAVRPTSLEAVAVQRALTVAGLTGCRLYITHVSSDAAVRAIRQAMNSAALDVSVEACLHHVLLDDSEYRGPAAGALLVAPPLRAREDVAAVQRALADGTVDALGSDHSQSRTTVDERICPCGDAAYGIAGIGARVPLALGWALDRSIPIERIAHLLATGPADAFGYRTKGRIEIGCDADLIVWNPARSWTVTDDSFDDGTGMAPYCGRRVSGKIETVVADGDVAVVDGQLTEGARRGRRLVPSARGNEMGGAGHRDE